MGLFDEIKKLTRPYDDEEEDELEEEDSRTAPEPAAEKKSNPFAAFASESTSASRPARREGRVVSINGGSGSGQMKVVLIKPERFETAAEIADHLRERHAIVMNLETTPKDVSRRLIDFLSGVAYAQDGKIKKIASNTYIITPYNVDLSGDLMDGFETGSAYL